ncbi:MAG TPA: tetratricopeptide repeat protein [Gaiellaceae bacterium]|nr:tetratricopeptide repeat protein [Gaiellaceae bacterium]
MAEELSVPDLIRAVEMLRQGGQTQAVGALYATWIAHNPENPLLYAVLFNYAVTLADAEQLEGARQCLERAIALNPDFMPAYINLGRIYERLGNVGLALAQWSAAIGRMAAVTGPAIAHKTTALNQSARALEAADQDEPAEQMLRHSLELDSTQREAIQHFVALRQRQCEWPVITPSDRVDRRTLMRGLSPLSAAALADDPLYQLGVAYHYNECDVGVPPERVRHKPVTKAGSTPLRIGYLSSDFREHAVGYLMTEVLGLHDPAKVETFAYYCGPESNDPLHQHFRSTAHHFKSLSDLDDGAAARMIADDGVQILVDLNGYTREARLKVVARRPAPVIVNWLGYPGTMGSPYHHYLIADDYIVPESHELYYSEKVLRLPCYQPSLRRRNVAAHTPSRSEVGLPEDATVYCCFNGVHKINSFTFDRWLSILSRVPGSVLWLLGSNEATEGRLRDYAARRGVAKERIVFARKLANPFHLARYALADLFLDTTPYGAHTTASDALWTGVPVLTLSGRSFASRVCGSLARAAGIAELVTQSAERYVELAVELGTDRAKLEPFRERLRAGRDTCTLFDMPLLVSRLEGLYEHMWRAAETKTLPRPDLGNLGVYLEVGCDMDPDAVEIQTLPDYRGFWLERLRRRHEHRPIARDDRLVTADLLTAWG